LEEAGPEKELYLKATKGEAVRQTKHIREIVGKVKECVKDFKEIEEMKRELETLR